MNLLDKLKGKLKIKVMTSGVGCFAILLPFLFLFFVFIIILFGFNSGFNGICGAGCKGNSNPVFVNVLSKTDGSLEQTLGLERYVECTIAAEVGYGYLDKEMFKAMAIAVRSYVLARNGKDGVISLNATNTEIITLPITNSSSDQNSSCEKFDGFSASFQQKITEAVSETKGVVLYKTNTEPSNILEAEYSNCNFEETEIGGDPNKTKVKSYCDADSYNKLTDQGFATFADNCAKTGDNDNDPATSPNCGHGRGMSQFGAHYLTSVENYDYQQLLTYYYYGSLTVIDSWLISKNVLQGNSYYPIGPNNSSITPGTSYIGSSKVTSDVETANLQLRKDVAVELGIALNEISMYVTTLRLAGGIRTVSDTIKRDKYKLSFHLTGRAFDLNTQIGFRNPQTDLYVLEFDYNNFYQTGDYTWIVYIRADKNLDTLDEITINGAKYSKGSTNHQEHEVVTGHFINLTELFARHGFARIRAQGRFAKGTSGFGSEWWHFQNIYGLEPGVTRFGDEVYRCQNIRLENTALSSVAGAIFRGSWFSK